MPLIELNTNPTDRQLRQFAGLVIPAAALVAIALSWWHALGWGVISTIAIVSVACAAIGMARPAAARPIYLAWILATYPIGWVVGHAVMAAVYFLILSPIGLIMRLIGRDPLARRFDPNRTSYWEPRSEETDPGRYFKQF